MFSTCTRGAATDQLICVILVSKFSKCFLSALSGGSFKFIRIEELNIFENTVLGGKFIWRSMDGGLVRLKKTAST